MLNGLKLDLGKIVSCVHSTKSWKTVCQEKMREKNWGFSSRNDNAWRKTREEDYFFSQGFLMKILNKKFSKKKFLKYEDVNYIISF
jgi:hypothetical protein